MSRPTTEERVAKLARPRLYGATVRPRVLQLLQAAAERSVVWVEAPPGAGKTTAVASFLDTHRRGGVWYQVDAGDADPASFFYYLALAAKAGGRSRPTPALPLFTPEFLPDPLGFARRFFRTLFGCWKRGGLLVLDNFQDAGADPAFHAIVEEAMTSVPSACCVLVISREPPPGNYARLFLSGSAVRLDASQFALTLAETTEIARAKLVNDMPAIETLHERCGGWVAGLALLLEGLRRGIADSGVTQSDNVEAVFDYFASQVINRLGPREQEWLMTLSLPVQLTPALALALTGESSAVTMLESLYRRHLFVYRRRTASTGRSNANVYVLHALFRDFLRHRARGAWSVGVMHAAMTQAAGLAEVAGAQEDAFEMYVEAGLWGDAVRILVERAGDFIRTGRWRTLLNWLARLPPETCHGDPALFLWRGLATMATDPVGARDPLETAYRIAGDTKNRMVAVLSASALIDSYILEYRNFTGIDAWIAPIAEALSDSEFRFADPDTELRIRCSALNAMTFRVPTHPLRQQCVERLFELLARGADPNASVNALGALLLHSGLTGRIPMGRRAIPMLESLAGHPEVTPHGLAVAINALAYHHTLDNEGETARAIQQIARLRGIAEAFGLRHVVGFADFVDYVYALHYGSIVDAGRWARTFERNATPGRPFEEGVGPYAHAWNAVFAGDPATAVVRSREVEAPWTQSGCVYWIHIWSWPLIWGLKELGEHAEARQRFVKFESGARGTGMPVLLIVADLMETKFALDEGDLQVARQSAARMIDLASMEGPHYLYRFRGWFEEVMTFALREGISPDHTRRIIRLHAGRAIERSRLDEAVWPWELRVLTFGPLAILRGGVRITHGTKAPYRVLALLKALLAAGPRPISLDRLADRLWPGEDSERSDSAIRVLLHRVRDLLGDAKAIRVEDGRAWIDQDRVWVDAYSFERCHDAAIGGLEAAFPRALALYAGPFLSDEETMPWCVDRRDRLRARFEVMVNNRALGLRRDGRILEALALFEDVIQREELVESFHRGRIACLIASGREGDALAAYSRLRQVLQLRLFTTPSAETELLIAPVRFRAAGQG